MVGSVGREVGRFMFRDGEADRSGAGVDWSDSPAEVVGGEAYGSHSWDGVVGWSDSPAGEVGWSDSLTGVVRWSDSLVGVVDGSYCLVVVIYSNVGEIDWSDDWRSPIVNRGESEGRCDLIKPFLVKPGRYVRS